MAGKLISLRQDVPIKNVAISSLTYSAVVDIGSTEGPFAMQVVWSAGAAPNINVSLEVSNNLQDWSTLAGTTVNVASAADNFIYDPVTSGAEFLRIKFAVVSGSATFSAYFNGKVRN